MPIALCSSFGKYGRYSSVLKVIVDIISLGVRQEYSSLYQIPLFMTIIIVKTLEIIVEAYICGTILMDPQRVTLQNMELILKIKLIDSIIKKLIKINGLFWSRFLIN